MEQNTDYNDKMGAISMEIIQKEKYRKKDFYYKLISK